MLTTGANRLVAFFSVLEFPLGEKLPLWIPFQEKRDGWK
jgi:hypothetical protein